MGDKSKPPLVDCTTNDLHDTDEEEETDRREKYFQQAVEDTASSVKSPPEGIIKQKYIAL